MRVSNRIVPPSNRCALLIVLCSSWERAVTLLDDVYIYIYIYTHTYVYIYIYIYYTYTHIYIERERDITCVYIYIYIEREIYTHMCT